MDTLLIGPFNTTTIYSTYFVQSIDNTESTTGIYYIYFTRYYVGNYYMYIRFRGDKAAIYL